MRQIKFRGKSIKKKEWVYGYYFFNGNEHGIVTNTAYIGSWEEVDPATVSQFTGLLDIMGGEVYSDDIVIVTNKAIYNGSKIVVWDEILLCHVFVWVDEYEEWKDTQSGTTYLKVSSGIRCQILGNIHDSPSLLTNK